jgi:polyribonucleotide nucleotidyltransferase
MMPFSEFCFLDRLNQINDKGQLRLSSRALLPDADSESNSSPTKEKAPQKDDAINMTSRRPRRKRQSEPSGAENATTKTLAKSTAAPAGSKGSEAA